MLRHLQDSNRSTTTSKSHRSSRDLLLSKQRGNNKVVKAITSSRQNPTTPDAGELILHLTRSVNLHPNSSKSAPPDQGKSVQPSPPEHLSADMESRVVNDPLNPLGSPRLPEPLSGALSKSTLDASKLKEEAVCLSSPLCTNDVAAIAGGGTEDLLPVIWHADAGVLHPPCWLSIVQTVLRRCRWRGWSWAVVVLLPLLHLLALKKAMLLLSVSEGSAVGKVAVSWFISNALQSAPLLRVGAGGSGSLTAAWCALALGFCCC
ncbi:hypothetical protein Nepgr_023123 [Nepenthes gracilis]|uniref:Uncharacterized protein n=1 Tax=Nepenthes gracilis TaxID=150966 RepID=A0AAD3T291_NEPGR|nr:hypothetical protein Nepgr_023123 [Nepenthes gracilis]